MKALTVKQPWGSLIRDGAKTIEIRSWPTSYRGPLAIHVGATWVAGWEGEDPPRSDRDTWPRSAIIAIVDLVDVRLLDRVTDDDRERACCDPDVGAYAWELANVRALDVPIPCKGSLGLWEVDLCHGCYWPRSKHGPGTIAGNHPFRNGANMSNEKTTTPKRSRKSKDGAPINPSSKTDQPWRDPPGPNVKLPKRWRESRAK